LSHPYFHLAGIIVGRNVGRIRQSGLWQLDSLWKLNSKMISGGRKLHAVVADFRTLFIMGPSDWEWPFLSDPPLPFTWSMESVWLSAAPLYLTRTALFTSC